MGFVNGIRSLEPRRIWLLIIAVIPYVDQEILGVIPIVRDIVPGVDPIYWYADLDWSERVRLAVLMVLPYVDGEVIELLGGNIENWYRD